MTNVFDCTEPTVINEQLITKAVEDERPPGEAGRIILQDGIDLSEIHTIDFSFRNILKIENLWNMKGLRRLNLDNNIIEKIEGLNELVNLRWLDLSFNNIEVIEGLETLVNLQDLSLCNNKISKIENLDNVVQLQFFSIGNNLLDDIKNVLVLRKMKHLQSINFQGNPISTLPDYKAHVVAYLPQLQFLDYRLIDDETKLSSVEKFQNIIEELTAKENALKEQEEKDQAEAKVLELRKAAFVADLKGDRFFILLFKDDSEGTILMSVTGTEKIVNQFRDRTVALSKDLFDFGLEEHTYRKSQTEAFQNAIKSSRKINQDKATVHVHAFLKFRDEILSDIRYLASEFNNLTMEDKHKLADLIEDYQEEITVLWEKLMDLEIFFSDQVEDSLKEFELLITELVGGYLEKVQLIVGQMRDAESQYSEQLVEVCTLIFEKIIKEEVMPTEDMREIFNDKDSLMGALAGSHDVRLNKIDSQEDLMMAGIRTWSKALLQNLQESEIKNNRQRVLEINNFIDFYKNEIDEFQAFLQLEETSEITDIP